MSHPAGTHPTQESGYFHTADADAQNLDPEPTPLVLASQGLENAKRQQAQDPAPADEPVTAATVSPPEDLDALGVRELRQRARDAGIEAKGLKKPQLVKALGG